MAVAKESITLYLLLTMFCLYAFPQPIHAAELAERFLRVPVFFITDRNLEPTKTGEVDFGPHRKYLGDCKHEPFMGSAYCVVENLEKKPLSDHLKNLGWSKAAVSDKVGAFKITPLTDDSFDKVQDTFYGSVREKALQTEDKNIFLFAHGYKNPFHGALRTAATLAYNAERPVIFYSWPSVAKLRSYTSDENNVEWSQEHFNDVIARLEKLCTDEQSLKVRLMAHSMGTRLLVRATPLLREKKHIVETALICPDVDDGLVKHYARRYLSVKGTTVIRLYMSQRDKALVLSQFVHGGYTRLGEHADAIGSWVTKTLSGQSPEGERQAASIEDAEFADRLAKTKKRMQTIDFTDIDTGPIGHHIPAKLICSMSFTNDPGSGLSLISEESGQRNKFSNLFTKLSKLKSTDQLAPTGEVMRVVKVDSVKGRAKSTMGVKGIEKGDH
ncbi:MAG: alpha/beta hydrolase [Candidatus Melainabacteria bacterium]|jgi:pimeloyl-ACP methyl ester carboxylesterase|nr:alpha/beta hydrolase [Candidatus Melainabacteria bacterium]